jgi:hypothetical protein
MKRRAPFAALALVLAGSAQAAAVLYDFNNFSGNLWAPSSVPAGMVAGNFDPGSPNGGFCHNLDPGGTNNFACGGFGNSQSQFTVQAQAGHAFDVLGFSFDSYRPSIENGTTAWAVYSSLDNFASALASGDFTGLAEGTLQSLSVPISAQGLQGPLTLRIVSTGRTEFPMGAWLLDNLRLEVNVQALNAVPAPATPALVLAGLLACALVTRGPRRRPSAGR